MQYSNEIEKRTYSKEGLSLNVLLGLKIRQIRKSMHLSQEDFAELVGVHRTYLGQIERAEKNISIRNIDKICKALKIKPKDLFDFSYIE